MRMLILAGGFGTRLKNVVTDVPKALAPVAGRPFLKLQLEHWIGQGQRDFVFLLHHQADLIIEFLRAQKTGILKDCKVDWVIEPTPMDTGGAVALAVKELNLMGDFLLTNADTWLGTGVQELILSSAPAIAVLSRGDVSRYGQVYFDQSSCVTAFAEKNDRSEAGWINAGLCHLNASMFMSWDGDPFSLERDLFSVLVRRGTLVAVPLQTDFIDIGIPRDYDHFCQWVDGGQQKPLCN